jgi:hypothetical protein
MKVLVGSLKRNLAAFRHQTDYARRRPCEVIGYDEDCRSVQDSGDARRTYPSEWERARIRAMAPRFGKLDRLGYQSARLCSTPVGQSEFQGQPRTPSEPRHYKRSSARPSRDAVEMSIRLSLITAPPSAAHRDATEGLRGSDAPCRQKGHDLAREVMPSGGALERYIWSSLASSSRTTDGWSGR